MADYAYRATEAGVELIGEHDELYLVLSGEVRFRIEGHEEHCGRGAVVAVRDPALRRSAVAVSADAALLAIGNVSNEGFASTWNARHFDGVPTLDS